MGYNGDGYEVGNENEGGHTGSGLDRSYPELTGVVSERVLTQRRNAMVEEVVQRFPEGVHHPGLPGIQSAELSINGMMGFMDCMCHEHNSDRSPNVPQGEGREAESGRQVNYLSVAHWPDQ